MSDLAHHYDRLARLDHEAAASREADAKRKAGDPDADRAELRRIALVAGAHERYAGDVADLIEVDSLPRDSAGRFVEGPAVEVIRRILDQRHWSHLAVENDIPRPYSGLPSSYCYAPPNSPDRKPDPRREALEQATADLARIGRAGYRM